MSILMISVIISVIFSNVNVMPVMFASMSIVVHNCNPMIEDKRHPPLIIKF